MLRVARQTDYAARIVLHLARLAGGMTTIARITQLDRLPDSFVRRLVGRMVKGGLLETVRGKKGGIRLARPAGQISLLDVVVAMEPPWNPNIACFLSPTAKNRFPDLMAISASILFTS